MLKGYNLKSSSLKLLITASLSRVTGETHLSSPENLQSCLVNPTFVTHSFYIWLPILPPRGKLSFFLLLVLLSKMLLINSGCNK